MNKIPPCKGGARHRWVFKRNVTHGNFGAKSASFSLKGWYRCEVCGKGKTGLFRHEETEPTT